MSAISNLVSIYNSVGLITKIAIGIVLGTLLAVSSPSTAATAGIFGNLFVGALKAVAPILVFFLVTASIANQARGQNTNMRPVIVLYALGTFAAALTAVSLSFLFPVQLELVVDQGSLNPPENIAQVLNTLLFKIVQNPVSALVEGNYVALVVWGVGLGLLLRNGAPSTITALQDLADAITGIVRVVIQFAPIGIFGLVASTVAATGIGALASYAQLIMLLIAAMLIIALLVNPALVHWKTKQNPYPLVLRCLRESGITAFFTRSSAANIPVNMKLCEDMKLDEDTYSISIPLGATVNMGGAAITVTIMTLAAVHTLGINVDLPTALLLSLVAALAACGASGVAGGSLLLIPLACGLFGISNDVAMQVVAVGFIIGVIQDSAETALNSSTDVIFTAAVCQAAERESSS